MLGDDPTQAAPPSPSPDPAQEKDPGPAKKPKTLTPDGFPALGAGYPLLGMLVQFLSDCYHVFDAADPAAWDAFIQQYQACAIDPLGQYATGLRKDYAAVQHSLRYPEISNGPREGMNSRITMRHRRGGGRAGIELLNAYHVLNSADLTG